MVKEFSVFGSCASRNIFNSNLNKDYKKSFHINYSVESSSIISLMSQPVCFEKKLIDSEENYYNKCVIEDLSKNFLNFLKEDKIDFLILDTYFDASAQNIVLNDDTYITETLSLRNQSLFHTLNEYPRISVTNTFEKYFPIFKNSCDKFFKFIKENCNDLKIILNCSRSVYKYMENGKIIENPDFKNSIYLNRSRNILDKYILENYDVEVLPFNENTLYDATYLFGVHHTHYEPKYFKDKTTQINNIIKKTETYGWNDPLYTNYRDNRRKITTFDWHKQELENKINNLSINELISDTMSSEIYSLLKKYHTARIDIKNVGEDTNNIQILNNSDLNSDVQQPLWFKGAAGVGTVIESDEGSLDLEIKCINSGMLHIWFRGIDCRDVNNNQVPIFIDFNKVEVNKQSIFEKNIVVCYDDPYVFKKDVTDGEIVKIHLNWLPLNKNSEFNQESVYEQQINEINSLNKNSEFNQESVYEQQINEINSLKNKLFNLEKQLNSIPQLSCTSFGKSTLGGKLIYRNWLHLNPNHSIINDLDGFVGDNHWFTRFLKHKFPDDDFKIGIFGVSNAHDNLKYPMEEKKFLYAPENLDYTHLEMKLHFDKYALDYVDLAMGYELIENPKYIRFPYWIIWHFSPTSTEEQIEYKVNSWNSSTIEKSKDVASISSHDRWGVRSLIDNDINQIVNIEYAGKWKNNTSELWDKFKNDKRSYLKQFKFNLCAENVIADGYITEKIFDAIHCDCIPLYAGGGNYLEPEVLNHKAIIRWEGDDVNVKETPELINRAYYGHNVEAVGKWIAKPDYNSDSVELFKNLITDEKTYREFKDQDKVLDSAAKFIINKYSELEKQFERLIYS